MQLQGNRLTCLTALGSLAHLTTLDVSNNDLTALLDLGKGASQPAVPRSDAGAKAAGHSGGACACPPPAAASGMREANFSYNKIAVIRDLTGFSRLNKLVLDGNQVMLGDLGTVAIACTLHAKLTQVWHPHHCEPACTRRWSGWAAACRGLRGCGS